MTWSPTSWRSKPIRQQPVYSDPAAVERALQTVRALPPLVARLEVDKLRDQLAQVAAGKAFLLQGGDCAERFVDCEASRIEGKLKILLQMSLVLVWGARIPVVRVARIAGQYAKPRSRPTEVVDGNEVVTYRGDHVNDIDPARRDPDPERLVQAYYHSATTLNYVRALLDGGFADMHRAHHWDLGFVRDAARRAEYTAMLERILDAVDFMEATGIDDRSALGTVDFYASHEGLLLPYEEAHLVQIDGSWYNAGAHMLWIGDRTRQLDGAHVEFFRGIENPVGVKVGPTMGAAELIDVLDAIEPDDRPGRIVLITRYGADRVADHLPAHIEAVQKAGRHVVWSCDPMHGNTVSTGSGVKTRNFDAITRELRAAFEIHGDADTHLGGVHFELTGDNVTECTGGPEDLSESDLARSYETYCDPRLNYGQSLELAFLLAQRLEAGRSRRPW